MRFFFFYLSYACLTAPFCFFNNLSVVNQSRYHIKLSFKGKAYALFHYLTKLALVVFGQKGVLIIL